MKHLTVRNVPVDVAEALEKERRGGKSLNQTVIDLMRQGLGVGRRRRNNGLERLAGTWSREQFDAFESAVASTEQVDDELWR